MAKKKDRAFFVCPDWTSVADAHPAGAAMVDGKILAQIKGGKPVAHSTLRKALLTLRHVAGPVFDVDSMIVDNRPSRG